MPPPDLPRAARRAKLAIQLSTIRPRPRRRQRRKIPSSSGAQLKHQISKNGSYCDSKQGHKKAGRETCNIVPVLQAGVMRVGRHQVQGRRQHDQKRGCSNSGTVQESKGNIFYGVCGK